MAHRLVFHPAIPDDLAEPLSPFMIKSSPRSATVSERCPAMLSQDLRTPRTVSDRCCSHPICAVERFPYLIFFVPRTESVSILAIAHGGSNPEKWRGHTDREP